MIKSLDEGGRGCEQGGKEVYIQAVRRCLVFYGEAVADLDYNRYMGERPTCRKRAVEAEAETQSMFKLLAEGSASRSSYGIEDAVGNSTQKYVQITLPTLSRWSDEPLPAALLTTVDVPKDWYIRAPLQWWAFLQVGRSAFIKRTTPGPSFFSHSLCSKPDTYLIVPETNPSSCKTTSFLISTSTKLAVTQASSCLLSGKA
ncbi:hypothetical protein HWV62_21316 [Athelia sp. TMB]|nr:hypothetical protein HWV62_21316 [Athelia sp. TMB]